MKMVPPHEAGYLASRLAVFLTSCEERRYGQWEHVAWWDFIGAASRSEEYQKVAARGLTRSLVAAKETVASTRTIGNMAEAFIMNIMQRGNDGALDRVLDAPTNEAWIQPWVQDAQAPRRALPHGPARGGAGACDGGRVRSAVVRDRRGRRRRVERRLVRLGDAGRAHRAAALPPAAARRPGAGGHPLAPGRLDGRDPVLPAQADRHDPRARHLRGLAVGADLADAGAVLGRARLPARLRRRQDRRLPLGRHLRLGHAGRCWSRSRPSGARRPRSSARSGTRSPSTSRTPIRRSSSSGSPRGVPRPRDRLGQAHAAATATPRRCW